MSEVVKRTANARYTIFVGAVFLFAVLAARADESISDGLQRCRLIEGASARLACYDGLSRGRTPAPIAASASVDPSSVEQSAAEQSANKSLADPGTETVRGDTGDKYETVTIRATVTNCRQGENKKYYFYFENGQVWKQSGTSRKKYEDCEFEASIMRDAFGYRMLPDGETQRIRITRVK